AWLEGAEVSWGSHQEWRGYQFRTGGVGMTALSTQVGGDHYRKLKIQPVQYAHANGLGFIEGSIVKYITRWRDKGGVGDLEKIKRFVDLLIELEGRDRLNGLCDRLRACQTRQNTPAHTGSRV